MNFGTLNGANVVGFAATGVLARDLLSEGDRLAITGGFGIGRSQTMGGRIRAQLSW